MKKYSLSFLTLIVATVFISVAPLYGQVSAIGSNLLRIGSGETDGAIGAPQKKRYLEEIANVRIFFDNITLGLRYEMDDPSEVGQSFQGIRRRWIEYNKDKLLLQAGDVSALYGRGLSVNAFEARPLNYDSWLDGVKGEYEYAWKKEDFNSQLSLGVRMIAGKLLFHNVAVADTGKPPQDISARAVNSQIGFYGKKLIFGASFLQAFTSVTEQDLNGNPVLTKREVNQPELYLNLLTGSFEGFFQWTEMRSHLREVQSIADTSNSLGHAVYGSLSFAGEEFGLTVEYKNYQYFVHAPNVKNGSYFSKLPISNPPEVYKEFTYTSLTRTSHSVNFDDEVGFEMEMNITAIPQYFFTLNAAASSLHNSYGTATDTGGKKITVTTASTTILPKFSGIGFAPFWEAFAEVEHEMGELNYIKFFLHRRSNVIVLSAIGGATFKVQRSTTIGGKIQYQTTKTESLLAIFEHQWMYDDAKPLNNHHLLNELLTLQYSLNPIITFGCIIDYSTQNEAYRHFWQQGFVSFRIGGAHSVLASYGAERGGLNCSGGICRVIPAFNGLRVTLISQI